MLADLTAGAVEDAHKRAADRPLEVVEKLALAQSPAVDALAALAPADRVKIIAEVKRASPSRGDLADIPDPALQAARYEQGGASAISVLTEGRKFKGSLADLDAVRQRVTLPVLRKDFIATPYQVLEARAAGADLVLLIVAALEQPLLRELHGLVLELGMTPLVETHSLDEVHRAADIGARLIGVNARNLSTFELDRDLFGSLYDQLPADAVKIAESAVLTPDDVAHYRAAGADVVLIGEALVTSDPVETLHAFLAAGSGAARTERSASR
ncbi:indole-3-glycerol phosphate synthase TrpC [Microbacterium sp. W1N]|uniref:indole-3-glycerol phosphate synthase TrpC n=1 Tax=Microbacterium festucae TaxID=2977531 RepID=UPI0021C1D52D|nr:indole-3-glycerol phosphate synthase TrpC [Microbacterium festucae]MCT9820213.1 indole-3-glycerol phosphate synthase TrpC [Microbacterium festucae]